MSARPIHYAMRGSGSIPDVQQFLATLPNEVVIKSDERFGMKNRFVTDFDDITLYDHDGVPYEDTVAECARRKAIIKRLGVESWDQARDYRIHDAFIYASVTSFSDWGWEIQVSDGTVTLSDGPAGAVSPAMDATALVECRLARLEATVTRLGVENWREDEFIDKDILDGTQWELTIRTTELAVAVAGSNIFPDGYDDMMNAVRALLGEGFDQDAKS